MDYQEPQQFKPQQPSWTPTPDPLWDPASEPHSFENQNPFGAAAEAEFIRPQPKKAKAAEEPQQQDGTEAKADGTQLERKQQNPFGVEPDKLEQMVGSAHAPEEAEADALAQEVRNESKPGNRDTQKQSAAPVSTDPGPDLPGLPKTGGTALPKDKKAQFERKVGNLDDVQVHKAPKHAKHLKAEAFTVGRHVYLGEGAGPDVLDHELGHFHPNDKKTKKIRRKAPDNSWVERQAELRRQQAAEAERKRKAAEAEAKRKAKIEADRKAAAARQRDGEAKARRMAAIEKLEQKALLEKQQQHEQKIAKAAGKTIEKPLQTAAKQGTHKLTDFSALKAKALKQKAEQKQEKLHKAAQKYPGIQNVLNHSSLFKGALSLGAGLMSPVLGASLLAGAGSFGTKGAQAVAKVEPKPEEHKEEHKEKGGFFGKALSFGKDLVKGAAKVGEKVVSTGAGALNTVANVIPQPIKDLANPVKLASAVVKGASAIAEAPQKAADGLFGGALNFGKKLFNGAKDLGTKALNTAGSVLNSAKDFGKKALTTAGNVVKGAADLGTKVFKGAVNFADSAIKTGTKLAKEFGEYAKKNPWEVVKMVTHGALDVLGFVPVFGAVADVANAGLYAAEGKYDMAAMSMLSAIPGVGDVLGPAAKAATMVSKAAPTAMKVAKTLSKAEKVLNSPIGKVVTNSAPMLGSMGTASVQTAMGNGEAAKSPLMNMGLPMVGKFGGKYVAKVGGMVQNPIAKTAVNATGKAISTGGKYAPMAMQGKDVVDKVGQYQRGEIKAEDVVQSVAGLDHFDRGHEGSKSDG